ncbi:MAG TPA: xanthine dehydrogenase family protein subunit M [Candidatus Fraserbacteria bacterium]|nr:xanthine dehydrogenase family protein subunit M [Candidatus Fraserbacteria bacterium]
MAVKVFFNPASPQEAVRIMYEQPGQGAYLAGGTDLLCSPEWPDFVVNIRGLLATLAQEAGELVIGAAATISRIAAWQALSEADDGLMQSCARGFASEQIRNMATVGGNLASAVPSADFATPLLALEAQCVIQAPEGQRTIPLEGFFAGPHQSVLDRELLLKIRLPLPSAGVRTEFLKIGRNPGDIATINVATLLELECDKIQKARIALGAVAPTPIRAYAAEEFLAGKPASDENIQRAADLAREAVQPISDQRASADYRRQMSMVLTRRALQRCLGRNQ